MSKGLGHTNQGRQRGLVITLLLIAAAVSDGFAVIPASYAFEFTGERWQQPIEYHYLQGCPAYVMPAIENAFATVSPIPFSNSGLLSSVGYDQKVTIYCAPAPIASQLQLPEFVNLDETHYSVDEATTGATTRRYWLKNSKQIVDFDIWLNSNVIDSLNIAKILNHEVLHGLGIRHSNNPAALMFTLPQRADMHADDIAAVNLLYDICEDGIDSQLNHFMHKVPFDGAYYYGILPYGGVWPHDVHTVGESNC